MEKCFNERIFYYWRHSLYGHAALLCDKASEIKKNDIFLIVWRSLSQAVVGDTEQSIETLNSIQYRTDLLFLFSFSNYFIQKSAENPDLKLITQFEQEIQKNNRNLPQFIAKITSEIAFLFNDYQLAEEIINNSEKTIQTLSILGWIKMMKGQFQESEVIFNRILKDPANSFHLLTLYGKACLCSKTNQSAEAIQLFARILSKFEFPEINFEKGAIFMSKGNWHSFDELMNNFKDSLPSTLEIDIFDFFNAFYQTGNISKAKESIEKVTKNCELFESKNWFLMARLSHAFGTLGCRNDDILFQSMKLSQLAVNVRPNNSYCLSVLGYHQIMNDRIIVGQNTLYKSIEIDPTNSFAEENIIRMNIKCGRVNSLKDELDLFNLLNEKNVSLLMFFAKVSRILHSEDHDVLIKLIQRIDEIVTSSMNDSEIVALKNQQFFHSEINDGFYSNIELPFNKIVDLTINLSFQNIFDSFDEVLLYHESPKTLFNPKIKQAIHNILKNLFVLIPESSNLRFYKGCFLFIEKKYYESLDMFQTILVSMWPCKVSYSLLMIATIYARQGEFELAQQYLKETVLCNSTISNETFYKLINLTVNPTESKMKKEYEFIMKSFNSLSFLNILSFVDIFIQQKEYLKALNILKLMIERFTNHIEKELIVIRQAKIRAAQNDLQHALNLLNRLKSHSKISEEAVKAQSEIYLNFYHDEENFLRVLIDNCNSFPTMKNFEMLGDGYSRLKQFNDASESYKKAIFGLKNDQMNPDSEIVQKCIKNLIQCHRYNDAVSLFIKVVPQMKSSRQVIISLLHQMVKIERLNEVKKCIASISGTFSQQSSFSSLLDAEYLAIKASIYTKNDDFFEVTQTYEKSINIYEEILNSRSINMYIKTLKEEAANICVDAGTYFEAHQKKEKAFEFYTRAHKLNPTNQKALDSLVSFHKQRLEVNKCISLCEEFLKNDPYDENAVLLFTSFQHKDLKKSIAVLKKFLTKKPHFHRVIIRLVEICSRAGGSYIRIAKRFLSSDNEPGMIFARGVFNVYRGEIESALNCFEKVKNNRKWGVPAKICMFSIYLNPEGKYIWEKEEPLSSPEKIEKARELFDQIYPQNENDKNTENNLQFTIEKDLLYAELEKSINTSDSITSAISRYSNIVNQPQVFSIPAIIGLASCYMRLSKLNEANALIDQVTKSTLNFNMNNDLPYDEFLKPTHETASYFEEAYLMRAQMMLNGSYSNNQQSALHYIFLALDLNQSCKKGWEMCAEAYSRSEMHADAANAYKHCWQLSSHQIVVDEKLRKKCEMKNIDLEREKVTEIGYSYAIASLKAKKPEDALEMCQEILDINPCFSELKRNVIIPSFKMLKS
ncbi:Tetratricopeptide repeat protein 21B [Tritrichomonas musculus]|uniref:Tetratricopeptide repeat protein 21B n=1 Tax=Tritrichomonas musculus TaxID=1915356 RepID=A0ABR2IM66_9EUKA